MKLLASLIQEKVEELVHLKFMNDVEYTLALHKLGVDGMNRPVYVGRTLITDPRDPEWSNDTYTAIVFRPDGTVLAMKHEDKQSDAVKVAGIVIQKQRKGYGPDLRNDDEHWSVYQPHEIAVDGYKGA